MRDAEEDERFEREAVADLHAALGRYPQEPELRSLVPDLHTASQRFAELWRARPTAQHVTDRKTFDHPQVGRITLDCDVLTVHGTDLRLIVYSAPPGSRDAVALELIGVVVGAAGLTLGGVRERAGHPPGTSARHRTVLRQTSHPRGSEVPAGRLRCAAGFRLTARRSGRRPRRTEVRGQVFSALVGAARKSGVRLIAIVSTDASEVVKDLVAVQLRWPQR